MLIIPLDQPLTLARFPWITALLILVNVVIYFGFQARDESAYRNAADHYRRSGLVELEWPSLMTHLAQRDNSARVAQISQLPEPQRSRVAVELQALDGEFGQRLALFPPVPEGNADALQQWRSKRMQFEIMLDQAVTPRYALLFHQPSALRSFTSMFMHGDAGHLFGNMLFLALLGLMTEAALGPWLFLGIYLFAGLGGGMVSLLRHFGDYGSLIGASGAIAGLMGACCVVWGMRKIRVFYWFFVIFDYTRVPALLLLPAWLGWELWQMATSPGAGIAFDAHAGGIICGALATFMVRHLGWERREVLDEHSKTQATVDLHVALRSALGKLEFAQARELSERLIKQFPNEREAWRLRLRALRDRPQDPAWHDAVKHLLFDRLTPAATPDEDIAIYDGYLAANAGQIQLSSDELAQLGVRWLQAGRLAAGERILVRLLDEAEPVESARRLALRLALAWHEANDQAAFQRVAGRLYARCPDSAEAARLQRLMA